MFIITQANRDDAASILALQKRAYESEARLYNDGNIPPLLQGLDSLIDEINKTTVLKSTDRGQIVGSVRSYMNDCVCMIGRLIVEPEYRKRGIGTALLQAIEKASPQAAQFDLFTGSRSQDNIRLYLRHGYEITHTKQLSDKLTLVYMTKRVMPIT
ncbi:MAG: GNAT family N-acetyltransferase [Acidobacteria bacterium]|nr:GNAT family N-acetyltransferase [Acidobacteriota bacterium]MBI3489863.1 GNAT family N-acetyltransferase [Acidobacteriota bacterium]